jgi:hypothetical protein
MTEENNYNQILSFKGEMNVVSLLKYLIALSHLLI